MNKAMLSQDYHDAGNTRVVAVLESIREGFLRKLHQAVLVAEDHERSGDEDGVLTETVAVACWKTAIDDIAWRIQREQRS